ncbi:MAG: HD-GYP domain-containing protein [Phycisphaerales bacterium]|nr:HD-GYP domain-containing protein [Phycisphaerales bacterium]
MIDANPQTDPVDPHVSLRMRCRAMGLPSWRCDGGGVIVADPLEGGVLGLWLRSPVITSLVEPCVRRWLAESPPAPVQMLPGVWAIPVPQQLRRRLVGWTVVVALGPAAIESDFFARACAAVQLDPHAAHRALAPLARHDDASVARTTAMIGCMAEDAQKISDHELDITNFTVQLTESFETIGVLYRIGRSMGELEHPARFVQQVCDNVHGALAYRWVGVYLADPEGLSEPMTLAGTPPLPADQLRPLLEGLAAVDDAPVRRILPQLGPILPDDGGQTLVQRIQRPGRAAGVLVAGNKGGPDPQVSSYDTQLVEASAGYLGAFLENVGLMAQQRALFMGTLEALTAAIDAKDRYTCGHSQRVALLASGLALALGQTPEQAERARIAGLVHDVGKIGVPEAVLTKPGRLSDLEFDQIKRHPEIGHRILRDIPMLADVLPGVLHHHEHWNGRGYPHGLEAESIPRIARMLTLADTFDAMSSTRSYRAAMPRDKVLTEIIRCAGVQFDPELARAFVTLDFSAYDEMFTRHAASAPAIAA